MSPLARYKARYFDGENASGAPFLHVIGGLFLIGYTIDCESSALWLLARLYSRDVSASVRFADLSLSTQTTCTSSTTRSELRQKRRSGPCLPLAPRVHPADQVATPAPLAHAISPRRHALQQPPRTCTLNIAVRLRIDADSLFSLLRFARTAGPLLLPTLAARAQ